MTPGSGILLQFDWIGETTSDHCSEPEKMKQLDDEVKKKGFGLFISRVDVMFFLLTMKIFGWKNQMFLWEYYLFFWTNQMMWMSVERAQLPYPCQHHPLMSLLAPPAKGLHTKLLKCSKNHNSKQYKQKLQPTTPTPSFRPSVGIWEFKERGYQQHITTVAIYLAAKVNISIQYKYGA